MIEKILTILYRVLLRNLFKPFIGPPFNIKFQRYWSILLGAFSGRVAPETEIINAQLNNIHTKIFQHKSARYTDHAILYLHGGAFVIGSPQGHKGLISHLSAASNSKIYAIDYRLAPEHRHPAQVQDALNAYKALLEKGYMSKQIAIAGDSAGGGLALMVSQLIRDSGLPLPAAIALFSPWTDFSLEGESISSLARLDPFLKVEWLQQAIECMGGESVVFASPLYANLNALPPILIQVGTQEILLSDSERLAERAKSAGIKTIIQKYDEMWHVFQLHSGILSKSNEALSQAGAFLKLQWQSRNEGGGNQ